MRGTWDLANFCDLVLARQDGDLRVPSFKLPPVVPSLVAGAASVGAGTFASVAGQQVASQIFAPAATATAA